MEAHRWRCRPLGSGCQRSTRLCSQQSHDYQSLRYKSLSQLCHYQLLECFRNECHLHLSWSRRTAHQHHKTNRWPLIYWLYSLKHIPNFAMVYFLRVYHKIWLFLCTVYDYILTFAQHGTNENTRRLVQSLRLFLNFWASPFTTGRCTLINHAFMICSYYSRLFQWI